jgi:lipopolysaccharide transport system permease protein
MIQTVMFRSLWAYRGFILANVQREFQQRYTHSLLGGLWAVLNPLTLIVIYTVIFAGIMQPRLAGREDQAFAYSVYLCAGLLPWTAFAELVNRMQSVFLQYGNLIKKSSFPRSCLPVIVALSVLIDFGIVFALYLAFLLIIGDFPDWVGFAFLPVFLIQLALGLGLGLLTATLNVFFRDVGQFVGVILQFGFWLTPIVYSPGILPELVKTLLWLNPLYPLITAYQDIFLNHALPNWGPLLAIAALALALLLWAGRLFLNRAGEIVDEL